MPLTPAEQTKLDYLKQLVALRVDEVSESADQINSDDINFGNVEYELDQAARKVLTDVKRSIALRSAVRGTYITPLSDSSKQCVVLPLPDDYIRFVSLKLGGWKTPVTGLVPDTSSSYRHQQFSMGRATPEFPKGFLVPYHGEAGSGDYVGGTVPTGQVYCILKTEGTSLIEIGDVIAAPDSQVSFTVYDNKDPDFIVCSYVSGNPVSGELIISSGIGKDYELTLKYLPGENYRRPAFNQAIEAYPQGTGALEELVYVPVLKSYQVPDNLEDALVWDATFRVLLIGGRMESAKAAQAEYANVLMRINEGKKGEEGVSG